MFFLIPVPHTPFPCQALAEDPTSGHMTTYSESVVHVRVVKLTGVKLYVPNTKLLSGVEVRETVSHLRSWSLSDGGVVGDGEPTYCMHHCLP